MPTPTSWTERLPTLTMALGIIAILIGVTAWFSLSAELRVGFFIVSGATGVAFVLCIIWQPWSRFDKPAVGVIPLLLFWLFLLAQPKISDGNMMRTQTLNNAKQHGLAFQTFQDINKHMPTDIRNDALESILSWRVNLCPYVDQGSLYKQFDLKQPWDGPANRTLLEKNPSVYMSMYSDEPEKTPWQAFVGAGTAFEPDGRKLSLMEDFPDGLATTVLIIEANQLVPWSKPADIPYGPNVPLSSFGREYYRETPRPIVGMVRDPDFHVIMADGSVRFLSADVSEETQRAMIVRDDGKR
jgi:hypothetical protein